MCSKLSAVAISITNKDSGIAWSFKNQYEKHARKVYMHYWSENTVTTSTCILFNKDKVFHSFGYESKNKYADLLKDEKHKDWYFFERFLSFLELQEVCMLSFKYISLADISVFHNCVPLLLRTHTVNKKIFAPHPYFLSFRRHRQWANIILGKQFF